MRDLIDRSDALLGAVRARATSPTTLHGAATLLIDAAHMLVLVGETIRRAERIEHLYLADAPRQPSHYRLHRLSGEDAGEWMADVLRTGTDG